MSNDPLLQPYRLKHLTLRNRILITSHEPAYPEDGMPKDRYRAYHVERAKAGVALTMTAGSASVSRDSPPVFNNVLVWKGRGGRLDEKACRRMPRPWRGGDDPAHPSRAAHAVGQGRLASGGGAEPRARGGPPRLPQADGGVGHRPHRGRLRRRGRADEGGGPRRDRARSLRPPARAVLVASDQRSRGAVGWQPREPVALHLRGARRDPQARRARFHRGRPLHGRSGSGGGDGPGRGARGLAPAEGERVDRFPERREGTYRHRPRPYRPDPDPGDAQRAPSRFRGRDPRRHRFPPPSMRRAFPTWQPRATPLPAASSTWWA